MKKQDTDNLCINYNGKTFTSSANSANGEVSGDTIFHYYQSEQIVWAEYAGGDIKKGYLIGLSDQNGNLDFTYQHINKDLEIKIGKCRSTPVVRENSKLELREEWQWLSGDQSKGTSTIVEM